MPINWPIILSGNLRYHVSIRGRMLPFATSLNCAIRNRTLAMRRSRTARFSNSSPMPSPMQLVPAAPVSARSITTAWSALRIPPSSPVRAARVPRQGARGDAVLDLFLGLGSPGRPGIFHFYDVQLPQQLPALGRGVLAGVEAVDLVAYLAAAVPVSRFSSWCVDVLVGQQRQGRSLRTDRRRQGRRSGSRMITGPVPRPPPIAVYGPGTRVTGVRRHG